MVPYLQYLFRELGLLDAAPPPARRLDPPTRPPPASRPATSLG
jgi:hypothetical protein